MEAQSVGTVDPAFGADIEPGDIDKNLKDIGQHLKKFNNTLGSLQQLGIHHDTPLPELILVGDQSSGKSSLMSAISKIILPRSDGVCTRCPIHIRLSSDSAWRCRITLQQDYAYRPTNNNPITEADVTDRNPFPPWVKQQRETQEFKMLYNKTDPIDEIVRWAQIAILNHNRNYRSYVPKDDDELPPEERDPERKAAALAEAERCTEAKFSPNTVAIEVKGPDLPDLSFYDMPGIFRNAKHEEDQFLVKVVENLVKSYVSHEKAIIMWAVPMNHDPETSSTFTLIRSLGAQSRTIGVMTKADLLPIGGHHQWLAMLDGQQHRVGRGYFITSRAPPSGQGDEHGRSDRPNLSDERAAEESFFNRQVSGADRTWPEEFAQFDDRCGIDQLVKFLAKDLAQEFARNLPALSQKLQSKLQSTQESLRKLPEMPANPEHEVRKSLLKFTTDFQNRLKSKAFAASWSAIAVAFKTRIIDLYPRYRLMPDGWVLNRSSSTGSDLESVISVNASPSLSIKRPRPMEVDRDVQTPTAQRRRTGHAPVKEEEANGPPLFNSPGVPPGLASRAPPNGRVPAKTLAQIRQLIRSEREAGKPGEIPYDVMESLCMEAVKPWTTHLQKFVEETMAHLRRELDTSLGESFKELKKRQVYTKAQKLTKEWLKNHQRRISEQLERNYRMETTKIYTLDDDSFNRHHVHESHMLKRNRHFYRMKQYNGDHTPGRLEDWDKMSTEARRKEEIEFQKEAAKLGEDPYKDELDVAARVRGYYLTAAMRFIDVTAMHITCGLFPDLVNDIEQYLDNKMGLTQRTDPNVFAALMEEEQSTADKRARLKIELQRFQRAVEEIADLNDTVTGASQNDDHLNGHDVAMRDFDQASLRDDH
ncbi:P-loop containing nucleoside triphosphate hydrolase protein [Coniella lustricola]|uniref:P-loop containing nucleoside triphosphate hydrolase protein n=1 Tax=Coniella lustricola TaxID=2025994 RepID=A0A2T2ZWA2_9PEZI|nr:P-loop containing nucleoside triphosphate hydrolase protein [Coniella lustricola]